MTFTSDSCAVMKHIEDLSPESRTEEMKVVDKVNKEDRDEEMDHGAQSSEESVTMDADELEEVDVAGEDGEDELEEGEIIDSDTDPGGEVTEVEEEEDDDRGYMGRGPPSDSEETVYPLSSEESNKSRVSFAESLTHSLEEATVEPQVPRCGGGGCHRRGWW